MSKSIEQKASMEEEIVKLLRKKGNGDRIILEICEEMNRDCNSQIDIKKIQNYSKSYQYTKSGGYAKIPFLEKIRLNIRYY